MQWSSKSIARLAGALAKAQAELVNPEKSLVARIEADRTGEVGKSFRYASLASGLEIVRKTLSQHAIAAVQTTAIDESVQIVKLTTVLAHSSGEWIASDWPVCAVTATEHPHRMGTALTYARRYALFTLVGIAGEDDLDAPDLQSPTAGAANLSRPKVGGNGHLNGAGVAGPLVGKTSSTASRQPILGSTESAALRDRFLAEISNLGSDEEAALWAHRRLTEKMKLTKDDAQSVETAFKKRLAAVAASGGGDMGAGLSKGQSRSGRPVAYSEARASERAKRRSKGIDKSVLALPEPRRIRDREHVRQVAKQPCLICGRQPCDAHHLRFAQRRAFSRKVSDEFTVPLCRGHHREVHRHGDEASWWSSTGIDPTVTARMLWLESHPPLAPPLSPPSSMMEHAPSRSEKAD